MIGFLGTVIGMKVQAFYAIAQSGSSATIDSFASGIYAALVTTVAGLLSWASRRSLPTTGSWHASTR